MGKTYAETGLDLSERYLAWYVAQPVTENISSSQAGEGLHLYDENPNNIFLYGGMDRCAGTLYAQGIGPVPESEYPYRGREGNLAYEGLLANKDAFIEAAMAGYRLNYYYLSEEEIRLRSEKDYESELSRYASEDAYSRFDDWTISENDESGSGKLRGTPYTLIDNNMFVYWVRDDLVDADMFDKEIFYEHLIEEGESKLLYKDSIDQIKGELYSGRGVSVDIRMHEEALNKETWAQYFDGSLSGNPHAVCIVGWDDDYDASNFKTAPPGNGAWIVKNSYGFQTDIVPGGLVLSDGTTRDANAGDWGIVDENGLHTGYFYLSYYDAGIGALESYDFDLRENHDQENALQLDYMPASTDEWLITNETPVWCANVFTLEKDMRIDEVATRFTVNELPLTGFTVTFDIYRLNDGAEAPDDGELLASCTREFRNCGYHRVTLDAPVYSKAGERLAVVVQQRHNYCTFTCFGPQQAPRGWQLPLKENKKRTCTEDYAFYEKVAWNRPDLIRLLMDMLILRVDTAKNMTRKYVRAGGSDMCAELRTYLAWAEKESITQSSPTRFPAPPDASVFLCPHGNEA